MSNTILVTGACGFTGTHMLEHLARECSDARIVATDLADSDRDQFYTSSSGDSPEPVYHRQILDAVDLEFVPTDMTDEDDMERLAAYAEYDTVYNIASLFDYFATRENLYDVNVNGTRNLLRALRDQEPRLIHWSTLGVLGDAGFDEPKRESDPYHPHNRYCESKVVQEQIVQSYSDSFDMTIIRPAPIYGPRHQYGVQHIVDVLERLHFVPVFKIYPRQKQLQFPSVHVRDLVRAATYLATNDAAIGEAYNVLSDCIRQDELMHFMAKQLSLPSVTIPVPFSVYAGSSIISYFIARRIEKECRKRGRRPLVDAPMVRYLTANMWFSNEKIKNAGFEFQYTDPRDGLEAWQDSVATESFK